MLKLNSVKEWALTNETGEKKETSERYVSLGDELRDLICKSGMTVNALARAAGIGQATLQRFMAKTRLNIRLDIADKVCHHLDLGMRLTTSGGGTSYQQKEAA